VDAIVARCEAGNIASIGVLDRAGFVRTGEVDDVIHWRTAAPVSRG
jgi:RimJ/RimL family protein N-acetyltransferase